MRLYAAILIFCLPLMGMSCGEPREAPPVTVTVKVPVPVPCDIQDPPAPAWAYDSADKAMPIDERVNRLKAEAVQREAHIAAWRAALAGCRGKP